MRAPSLLIVRFVALLSALHGALASATPNVSATATSAANNLTMDGGGSSSVRIVKIADLSLSTDDADGFLLSVSSGSLTKAGGSPVPFQVALVANEAAPPSAAAFTVSSGGTLTHSTTSAGAESVDLYIKYQSANLQDPGTYSASINLSIVDN
jgi:hypothetical protein